MGATSSADPAARRRLYAWIAYNVVLYATIVVSGAILFMVIVGMITVGGGDEDVKKHWIEVNSQILNGVFTWMAITNHPFFLYRLGKTLQVLGIRRWDWVAPKDSRVRAARYLSRHFPLVFVDTVAIHDHKMELAEAQEAAGADDDNDVYLLADMEEVEQVDEIAYVRSDAENLRNTFVMLNWNCLFQYPITAVMWAYNSHTRPGFVIGVFLPLSFMCNFGGQYRIYKLNKDIKARRANADPSVLTNSEN
ncbi:Integral membrane protein [Phytophthora cinnamomi]|uniref:Integral membrane protein n=1 Tax=Phytophthora cinnamomi TaxID=4785 RepID=UPI00355A1909|nr:Integral membrane protein [Phytophthora cinnamomi]